MREWFDWHGRLVGELVPMVSRAWATRMLVSKDGVRLITHLAASAFPCHKLSDRDSGGRSDITLDTQVNPRKCILRCCCKAE